MDKEYFRLNFVRLRNEYIQMLGEKCVVCGTTEDLQFDHIDPQTKEKDICRIITYKRETVLKELVKCQLLCNPHHLEKTIREKAAFTHGTQYGWMKAKCKCEICLTSKRDWYDKRNIKRRGTTSVRGPYNQSAEHGTIRSYNRGCSCDLCKAANAKKERERRANK